MSRPVNALPIAVFGATGHTGRFVVQELCRRGRTCRAIGRDGERLQMLGADDVRAATLDDVAALTDALSGTAAVIHCAGPFLDTAGPVIRAALAAGVHYLDVTAEQQSVRDTYAEFDGIARSRGVTLVPAAGFFGGLADLLVATALDESEADSAVIAVFLDRWRPTQGTRVTGARNQFPRVVVRDGTLVPLAGTTPSETWNFPAPYGRVPVAAVPLSEIVTIARHGRIRRIDSLMNRSALVDLADPATDGPHACDDRGRSAQRFVMDVHVATAGRVRRASAVGQDIYAVTAPLVVEAALRIVDHRAPGAGGCVTLSELGMPGDFLSAIAMAYPGFDVTMTGDGGPP